MKRSRFLLVRSLNIGMIGLLFWESAGKISRAQTEIRPDSTLGSENSTIDIQGNSTFINGGATRGLNLFHSFDEFNVPVNEGAYFLTPNLAIESVFSRITGSNPSNIDGVLGVLTAQENGFLSTADLYFINPSGVVFGPSAQLDLGGSLLVTTADAVQFGNGGIFSASSPNASTDLLTVSPSAFLFNRAESPPSIVSQSATANFFDPQFIDGLRVPDGKSLLFLGGDVQIQGGALVASGGQVVLAAVNDDVAVGLAFSGDRNLSLAFPAEANLADITFINSLINLNGSAIQPTGGEVQTHSRQLRLDSSAIQSNNFGAEASNAITINAEQVILNSSTISTFTFSAAEGGEISINTDSIDLQNGSQITTGSRLGDGRSGKVSVSAANNINLDNQSQIGSLFIGSSSSEATDEVSTESRGSAGNVLIQAENLNVQQASGINSFTFLGRDEPGNVTITAKDTITLSNSTFSTASFGENSGGEVTINTENLIVDGTGSIATNAYDPTILLGDGVDLSGLNQAGLELVLPLLVGIDPGTLGQGDSGSIRVNATGNINLTNGGQLQTSTSGRGNGGSIFVSADILTLEGVSSDQTRSSTLSSETGLDSSGDAGAITITTRLLSIQEGATISTATFGTGKGGNLIVTATESTDISGSNVLNNSQFSGVVRASLRSNSNSSGQAGNVGLNTGRLSIREGGSLEAIAFGAGDAGNISVVADSVVINGIQADGTSQSTINSTTALNASGNAGDINITTGALEIQEGATISTATFGTGEGGDLTVTATESTNISGSGVLSNDQFTGVVRSDLQSGTSGSNRAGSIKLTTGRLSIQEGGGIETATSNAGRAGDITVIADSIVLNGVQADGLLQSTINSETTPNVSGSAGNIDITTRTLEIQEGAGISTATFGTGEGGNLTVTATESTDISGSNTLNSDAFSGTVRSILRSNTNSSGQSGNIELNTGQLSIQEGGGIEAVTFSAGRGGDITIVADSINLNGFAADRSFASAITSETGLNTTGNAGNITVSAQRLNIEEGAAIATTTAGSGEGGNLEITATESTDISGAVSGNLDNQFFSSRLITSTSGPNKAGNLQLTTGDLQVRDGGLILASSFGAGAAGNISVSADAITLSGTAFGEQIRSGIGSSSDVGIGSAGSIDITARSLSIEERAVVNTSAIAGGLGGNIKLKLEDTVDARNGDITSAVSSSTGGNIDITARALRFQENSNIFTTSQAGDGGDITISAPAIVLLDDSDIFAFAPEGEGGNIRFNTRALLTDVLFRPTLKPDDELASLEALDINDRVDIDASGTVSGQVTDAPNINFLENSIVEVSAVLLNSDSLVANSCVTRSNSPAGTFIVTSTESAQEQSSNVTTSYPTGTIRTTDMSESLAAEESLVGELGNTIEEPEELYRLADGRLVMSRACL